MSGRIYYRVVLKAESALSIGAADSVETDCDVVRDGRGVPFIPASTLRGVCRSLYEGDDERQRRLFGSLKSGEGVLRFYDATFLEGNRAVSVRDNVRLRDGEKTAEPGLKFDRQIVEPGARFLAFIEVLNASEDDSREVDSMLCALRDGILRVGSKATRGLGRVSPENIIRRKFDFADAKEGASNFDRWLKWDMFGTVGDSWPRRQRKLAQYEDAGAQREGAEMVSIRLRLGLTGAISVREYSTEPDGADYAQLALRCDWREGSGFVSGSDVGLFEKAKASGGDSSGLPVVPGAMQSGEAETLKKDEYCGLPVVPGTSWAGAFRSRFREFAKAVGRSDVAPGAEPGFVEKVFGTVRKDEKGKSVVRKSLVSFSESVIRGGVWKTVTRNSIDRVTGGTKGGALFTERTYYGGETELAIGLDAARLTPEERTDAVRLLAFCVADLHSGLLSVGGLTSVGHGLFEVREIAEGTAGLKEDEMACLSSLLGFEENVGEARHDG